MCGPLQEMYRLDLVQKSAKFLPNDKIKTTDERLMGFHDLIDGWLLFNNNDKKSFKHQNVLFHCWKFGENYRDELVQY